MKTQHTPGPWQISPECNWKVVTGHDADGDHELIAETGFIENAHLIAAAPELLEALELCLHAVDLALCGTPSAHYFNELKARLNCPKESYTLEDNLKLNMADIKGACTKAHKAASAAIAKAKSQP